MDLEELKDYFMLGIAKRVLPKHIERKKIFRKKNME